MSQEAFEPGDWQAVIAAHPLANHDPAERLGYWSALLHTLKAEPEAGKQQQQAALVFVQSQKGEGCAGAVATAERQVVMTNLRKCMEPGGGGSPSGTGTACAAAAGATASRDAPFRYVSAGWFALPPDIRRSTPKSPLLSPRYIKMPISGKQ